MTRRLLRYLLAVIIFKGVFISADVFAFSKQTMASVQKQFGAQAKKRVQLYERLINRLKEKSEFEKLLEVNRFVNQMQWVSDTYVWKQEDYWATPLEFLGKNMGDCEDYVISKYFALRQSGVSDEKLYFSYVKVKGLDKVHMVLIYYPDKKAIPLVLDNINKKVLPATHREEMLPVYSFNANALFLAKRSGRGLDIPSKEKQNAKWIEFIMKLEKETM